MKARLRWAVIALVVIAAGVGVGTFAMADRGPNDRPTEAGQDIVWPPELRPADSTAAATASRHLGPQGRTGQFVASCTRTHSAPDDPIVHPKAPGRSHLHDFYGATDVDAFTTPGSMLAGDTSCSKTADRAAYWHPAVYDHGKVVEPTELNAYYRAAPGVDPKTVKPFPSGIAIITGDMTHTTPQEGESVGWTCGTRSDLSDAPPECPSSAPLTFELVFQDCWDGKYLDSVDHQSHVTYSVDGKCPASHPEVMPQLTVTVTLPIHGPGHEITLASGNVYSLHGDFFNGWLPDGLAREVNNCIHRGVVCNLRSNRDEPIDLSNTPLAIPTK